MELHFTGTGAAYYPRLGSNAAFFVKNNHLFMIDCGESTFRKMEARDEIRTCDKITVFITHLHADHIGSLGSFASYCLSVLQKRITVIAQDDTVVEILKLMGVPADMYDFTTDHTRIFEDGLHVEAVPVKHASDMKCCGLLICDEEETTYFSADASELSDDILQQFKQGKIQVIYHDCTFLTKESPSHCSLKRLCEYIPPEMRNRVYCMHFGGDFMSQIKEAGFQVVTSV